MLHELSADTLSHLDDDAKREELSALVDAARHANGHATKHLRDRVRQFELRYEMSTDELLAALERGDQKETADIAEWLFWYDALEAHDG